MRSFFVPENRDFCVKSALFGHFSGYYGGILRWEAKGGEIEKNVETTEKSLRRSKNMQTNKDYLTDPTGAAQEEPGTAAEITEATETTLLVRIILLGGNENVQ